MRPRTAGTVRLPLLLAGAMLLVVRLWPGRATSADGGAVNAWGQPLSPEPSRLVPGRAPRPSGPAECRAERVGVDRAGQTSSGRLRRAGRPSPTPTHQRAAPSPTNCGRRSARGPRTRPTSTSRSPGRSTSRSTARSCRRAGRWYPGTYRLANGGHITIQFRRRSDNATFELDEGSFCADGSGCVPAGSAAGSGPFGDLTRRPRPDIDGYALVVAKGEKPSWLAVGNGLDQADVRGPDRRPRTRSTRRPGPA